MIPTLRVWTSDAEVAIQSMANKETSTWRSQEQFFSDIKKVMSDWVYTTQDEAINWVLSYAKSKWINYDWIDTDSIIGQTEKKREDISIFKRFWDTFKKRWEAWAWILTRWATWDTWAIEGWALFWMNFLWTLADLTWDVIAEWFTEIDQFWDEGSMQDALESGIQSIAETDGWEVAFGKLQEATRNLEDLKKLDPVKWARFQWGIDFMNWALELAWIWATTKWAKVATVWTKKWLTKAYQQWVKAWQRILKKTTKLKDDLPWFKKVTDDKILRETWLQTQKWLIKWKEVEVPIHKEWVISKVTKPRQVTDTKVLAGKALSPRVAWKWRKQRLSAIANAETNLNKFYENVRTWVIEWNIDTLENAAQTAVDWLDVVWARIGKAVEKMDDVVKFDNTLLNKMKASIEGKWAKRSGATVMVKDFVDDIAGGQLSFADAFELKKVYANEVSKLYKAWDAWTKQYKALSDGVDFLNKTIETKIITKLWTTFKADKELYASLIRIVDDLVHSAMVEWRKAPNTLAEQIWFVEGLFSPVWTLKNSLIKEIGKWSTRWGAFQELIKQYDSVAVKWAKHATEKWVLVEKVLAEIKDIPITQKVKITTKILDWVNVARWQVTSAKKLIKDFITKHWESFKTKLWELFDDLADKVWARSKFIDDSGFKKAGAAKSAKEAIRQSRSQKIVYHWTNAEFDKFLKSKFNKWATSKYWQWVYLSTSHDVANVYWDMMTWLKWGKQTLLEVVIPEDMKLAKYTWDLEWLKLAANKARIDWFKWIQFEAWKDVPKIAWKKTPTEWEFNYIIFKPEDAQIIKTHAIKELGRGKWLRLLAYLIWWWTWLSVAWDISIKQIFGNK